MSKNSESRLIAKRYAKALLELAGGDAASLVGAAKALKAACNEPDMQKFVNNPLLTREQSASVTAGVLDKVGAPKLLKDTAARMAHNRRLPMLGEMLEQFILLVEQSQNIIRVKIVSAKELTDKDIAALSDKISAHYGCKLEVETEIKPEIIGGVQLHMGDKHMDYSVAGKLTRLAEHLKHSPLSSKG